MIYDQPNNESFCHKIEIIQCNAAIAIFGAIRRTSQLKLYGYLGLKSLKFRRQFRRLIALYKRVTSGLPQYLIDHITNDSHSYKTRSSGTITAYIGELTF